MLIRPRDLRTLFVLAVASLCIAGCAAKDDPPGKPVTMRIGLGAPTTAQETGLNNVISAMSTEPWFSTQFDGRQSDKAASAWSWDESRTRLRLTLRKEVFFHDGTPVTPEIGVEALRKSIIGRRGFANVRSVEVSGPDTIDITLSQPHSFFLEELSIVSLTLPGHPEIGTGPFKVVKTDPQQASLEAFDKYYRGRSPIAEVVITNYPTQRNAWAALLRGEIDMLYEVGPDLVDFVLADSSVHAYTFPRSYYNTLVFNQAHPVLKAMEVRRGINEALNRAVLISEGMKGQGRPAEGALVPEHWAYSPPSHPFTFDPAAARARFERAGLPIRPGSGGRMPSRFAFTCLVFGDSRFERLAVLMANQLADVGVDMRLEAVAYEPLVARLGSGDFDAFLFEMAGKSLGWVYEFWHSHERGRLKNGYRSADAVLDRMRGARTDAEIRKGTAELQQILQDDPPAAFLAWQTTTRAVSKNFDVAQEPGRDILSNVWKWRPAGAPPIPR